MSAPEVNLHEAERRVEELESELERVRRDMWSARDALIGAEASNAVLRADVRDLEVRVAQLSRHLAEQDSLHRLVGRVRRDPRVRSLEQRLRRAVGRSA